MKKDLVLFLGYFCAAPLGRWRGAAQAFPPPIEFGLVCVRDVEASSRWYQQLVGCQNAHGGREYERLVSRDGRLILQLHSCDVEHHHLHDFDPIVLTHFGSGHRGIRVKMMGSKS